MLHGIYQMTPRQFHKAMEAGVFGENRVELLGGVPFIMAENPPHNLACLRLLRVLFAMAPAPRWVVNREQYLALGRWRPIADGIVLRGPDTTYGTRMPR